MECKKDWKTKAGRGKNNKVKHRNHRNHGNKKKGKRLRKYTKRILDNLITSK